MDQMIWNLRNALKQAIQQGAGLRSSCAVTVCSISNVLTFAIYAAGITTHHWTQKVGVQLKSLTERVINNENRTNTREARRNGTMYRAM